MRRTISFVICIGILWTFCTDYNPFDNPANINMVIQTQGTSLNTDTINLIYIFTTETLTVAATIKEKIDSFTISAVGNRYWEQQSLPAPISAGNYTFLFSYPDTGQKTITVNTYRNNGDIIPLTFSLRVTSPLSQANVSGGEKDTVLLSTPAVGDNDVLYTWQFEGGVGSSKIIPSSLPSFTYPVDIIGNGTGYLWVTDTMGNSSPWTSFSYNFFDTTGPVILCINEGLFGDTVVTGAKTFNFKVECNDGLGIGGAVINDTLNFKDSTVNIKSTVYYRTFEEMDTLSTYLIAVVKAWDNDTNENSHTFYLRYDINGPKEVIFIKYPPQNPYTTNQQTYDIVATIFNPEDDSVIVTIDHFETGISLVLDTLAGGAEEDVTYTASLLLGSNTIIISVLDTSATVIAKDTVGLTYTTGNVIDVIPPYISSISVNGNEGKSHYIAGDYAYLELEAFDEHMDSVVINGKLKSAVSQYIWRDTLALTGSLQYFIIHLTDSSNNTTDDTVRVQKNHLPVISSTVSWPKTLIIGRQWTTTFTVNDDDGDSVFIDHVAQIGSTIPQTGAITFTQLSWRQWGVNWNGGATLTNQSINQTYLTDVALTDRKQVNSYPWNFTIKDSTQAVSYIFKMFLPNGVDTTNEGDLDLSQINKAVSVTCLVTGDALPLLASDSIAVILPDQTIKFAATADTCIFTLSFNPLERAKDELMIIKVIDSNGLASTVDTVKIIYFYEYPDYIDSLGWLMHTDTGIREDDSMIIEWKGIPEVDSPMVFIKCVENQYTNDLYVMNTTPLLSSGTLQDFPIIKFDPVNHSNLLYTGGSTWIKGPFTLFFVARLDINSQTTGEHILLSTGSTAYVGLGVFNGKMGITGQLDNAIQGADTTLTCNMKVTKGAWHVLCFTSETGVDFDVNHIFTLDMWVDGFATAQNSISIKSAGLASDYKYIILGGGSKHTAAKNWDGDMVEIIEYPKYLDDDERDDVFRYLASKYKITFHSNN